MEKVSCDICNKKFKTAESLNQHKNDAHQQKSGEVGRQSKKKLSVKKILVFLVPLLILVGIGYGIYWALTAESIGPIGSTHIHTDFAIFLDGKQITPLPAVYYVRSPSVHIETGAGAGTVIHIHATDVPLKMFFDSLRMKFNSECFEVDRNEKYCNSNENTLKMFVKHNNETWEQNSEYEKYVFKDLDKILITYGDEAEEEIMMQQNNVTDFSKDNSGKSMAVRR